MKNLSAAHKGRTCEYFAPEVILLTVGPEAGFAVSTTSNESFTEDSEQNPW